jgi:hypothetical protein
MFCWTVVRQVAPHIHRHGGHLAHHYGRVFHKLAKLAHHPVIPSPTMLVCRLLPMAIVGGLAHIPPADPVVAPRAMVQQVQPMAPLPPSGMPAFPSPFVGGGYVPPSDPGTPVVPPVSDPPPNVPPIVTTYVVPTDPGDPSSPVDEPSSGLAVLGGIASLLVLRRIRFGA